MPDLPLVCDTTLLLYLGRIGQIDLLPALFTPIYVPEPVMLELDDALTVQGFRLDNDLYQDILSLAGEV